MRPSSAMKMTPVVSRALSTTAPLNSKPMAPKGTAHIINTLEGEMLSNLPKSKAAMATKFQVGDKIEVRVSDPGRTFTNNIVGVCIGRSRTSIRSSFKVLSVVLGTEVEHLFHLYSPLIEEIKVLKTKPKVRRAKLYYLRGNP